MSQPWSPATRGATLRVQVDEVLTDPKSALSPVLRATPGWQDGAAEAATVEQVSGAMTNLVFRCATPGPTTANAAVIVRVFGSGGKLFSQKDERNIFLLASQLGLGPRCLVEFENGRVEEFLPGDTLTSASMRQPDVSAAIAAAMAAFHVRMLSPPPAAQRAQQDGGADGGAGTAGAPVLRPAIYDRIRKWHTAALEVCGAELAEFGLADLPQELAELEARLAERYPSWVGFCHNDLQYGNMLVSGASSAQPGGGTGGSTGTAGDTAQPASAGGPAADAAAAAAAGAAGASAAGAAAGATAGAAGGAAATAEPAGSVSGAVVNLIDYEYSTLNDVAFDVANHFCEWSYNYHSDEAHVFHCAWQPTEQQQLHFCRAYVAAMQAQQAQRAGRQQQADQASEGGEGVWLPTAILSSAASPRSHGAQNGSGDPNGPKSSTADGSGGADVEQDASAAERVAVLLHAKARAHAPLAHLKWGLWGLIQHKLSDVDFDYLGYARYRIQQYHATKHELLTRQ